MPGTFTPISGSETSATLTVNGALFSIEAQVDGVTVTPIVAEMEHMPLGSMEVERANDFRGYEITLTLRKANDQASRALTAYEEAVRAGLSVAVAVSTTERYRDGTRERWLYSGCIMQGGPTNHRRGEMVSTEIRLKTGAQRVAL